MSATFTTADLEAYLDEALPVEQMAALEQALRGDAALARRLAAVSARQDSGVHTLGAIWRRHRLSCPTREQLGSLLLGVLDPEFAGYLRFHLETIGCRRCLANLADLQAGHAAEPAATASRRSRYFQSSAGQLRSGPHRR
jgi:hypothetical protein